LKDNRMRKKKVKRTKRKIRNCHVSWIIIVSYSRKADFLLTSSSIWSLLSSFLFVAFVFVTLSLKNHWTWNLVSSYFDYHPVSQTSCCRIVGSEIFWMNIRTTGRCT
jgi:hypothetical protein